jgi:hypothetical protein
VGARGEAFGGVGQDRLAVPETGDACAGRGQLVDRPADWSRFSAVERRWERAAAPNLLPSRGQLTAPYLRQKSKYDLGCAMEINRAGEMRTPETVWQLAPKSREVFHRDLVTRNYRWPLRYFS